MLFNSLSFVPFFLINVALFLLPFPWTIKKFNLLVASYLFYAAWSPPFVLLLLASAAIDFFLAHALDRTESERWRKSFLAVSIILNLGLLTIFKYGGFIIANLNLLVASTGVTFRMPVPSLILPLGISFYTFETVSYLIDVYRRRIRPCNSFLDYALFLTFFPHLVAGPIVRAADFLPQCATPRRATWSQFGWGLFLMLLGMAEKTLLADRVLAVAADKVFSADAAVSVADAWIGATAFAGQIFCDFAGYSTCGIGAALCLGFELKRNFHFPFAAVGFSDFWRRWHISLSTWLRDYLYIPLGGNRGSQWAVCRNLMITMLLGGLWHGASWRFVAWGGLHGSYLLVERFVRQYCGDWRIAEHRLFRPAAALMTFVLILFTWVYFRAADFDSANRLIIAMFGMTSETHSVLDRLLKMAVLAVVFGLFAGHWFMRDTTLDEAAGKLPWYLLASAGAIMALALILVPGDDRAFIYFQF